MPANHMSRRDIDTRPRESWLPASRRRRAKSPTLPSSRRSRVRPPARKRGCSEAGNRRFMEGKTRHAHESADWRKMLTADQHPFATLLCCSDSRVPPELVFDQGFGELFVIRVAGNVINTDILGSIQYAVRHLHTHLLVVMGHEGCGAVGAAIAALGGKTDGPRHHRARRAHRARARGSAGRSGRGRALPGGRGGQRALGAPAAHRARSQYPAEEQKSVTLVGAVYELADRQGQVPDMTKQSRARSATARNNSARRTPAASPAIPAERMADDGRLPARTTAESVGPATRTARRYGKRRRANRMLRSAARRSGRTRWRRCSRATPEREEG